MSRPGHELDTTALTEPFVAAPGEDDAAADGETRFVLGCGVVAFGVLMLGLGWIFSTVHPASAVVAAVLFVAGTTAMVRGAVRSRRAAAERTVRLTRFARANRMRFEGHVREPVRAGTIFADGINRHTRDQVVVTDPRVITLGRHTCSSGSVAGNSHAHPKGWGFATTKLAGGDELPHLFLEATEFDRDVFPTPVALGPHFLDRFDLPGDGGDAYVVRGPVRSRPRVQSLLERSLFTPEVLALLTERPVDIEVVDGHLVLMARETVGTDPDTWRWILTLTVAVAESLETAGPWAQPRSREAL